MKQSKHGPKKHPLDPISFPGLGREKWLSFRAQNILANFIHPETHELDRPALARALLTGDILKNYRSAGVVTVLELKQWAGLAVRRVKDCPTCGNPWECWE